MTEEFKQYIEHVKNTEVYKNHQYYKKFIDIICELETHIKRYFGKYDMDDFDLDIKYHKKSNGGFGMIESYKAYINGEDLDFNIPYDLMIDLIIWKGVYYAKHELSTMLQNEMWCYFATGNPRSKWNLAEKPYGEWDKIVEDFKNEKHQIWAEKLDKAFKEGKLNKEYDEIESDEDYKQSMKNDF